MRMYQSDSLENVFLKLSLAQIQGKRRRSMYLKEVTGSEDPAGVCIIIPFNVFAFLYIFIINCIFFFYHYFRRVLLITCQKSVENSETTLVSKVDALKDTSLW